MIIKTKRNNSKNRSDCYVNVFIHIFNNLRIILIICIIIRYIHILIFIN